MTLRPALSLFRALPLWLLFSGAVQAQSTGTPAPTNVWAAQTSLQTITLVWTRQPKVQGYRVYPVAPTPKRGIPQAPLAKTVDRVAVPVVSGYSGVYSYDVVALYAQGRASPKVRSNAVLPVTKKPAGDLPAPASVKASQSGPGAVTVSWTAVTGATGYFIGRSVSPEGFKKLCDICSTQTSYVDRNITAGQKHIYAVAALSPLGAGRRARSNEVIPTGGGDNGGGPDTTSTDSSATAPADTLLPHGVRLFTARNERGQVRPLVRLTWSPDLSAARYLIAFVDTVDDAHYGPEELFAERTIYRGSDTATVIQAPGDTARTTYAIVSENSHGRSEVRYATRAGSTTPRDSTVGDSTASDTSGTSDEASAGPQGVRSLKLAVKRDLPSAPGVPTAVLTWSSDPKAERYRCAISLGEDSTWHEIQVKPATDTICMTGYYPSYPREEWRASVVSED